MKKEKENIETPSICKNLKSKERNFTNETYFMLLCEDLTFEALELESGGRICKGNTLFWNVVLM